MNKFDGNSFNCFFDTKEECISLFNDIQCNYHLRSVYINKISNKCDNTLDIDYVESIFLNDDGTINYGRYNKVLTFMTFILVISTYIGDVKSIYDTITDLIRKDDDTSEEFLIKLASIINSYLSI